jgi:hypothetical protein
MVLITFTPFSALAQQVKQCPEVKLTVTYGKVKTSDTFMPICYFNNQSNCLTYNLKGSVNNIFKKNTKQRHMQ